MFRSTKHYGHELGLSACFRQWRANSHCNLLHGYALAFTFTFEAEYLDERNWVVDFGGLDRLKERLKHNFDHKLVVAQDDPHLETLCALAQDQLASVMVLPYVGCEAFAKFGFQLAQDVLAHMGVIHARVVSCEVREHGANSAIYHEYQSGDFR